MTKIHHIGLMLHVPSGIYDSVFSFRPPRSNEEYRLVYRATLKTPLDGPLPVDHILTLTFHGLANGLRDEIYKTEDIPRRLKSLDHLFARSEVFT